MIPNRSTFDAAAQRTKCLACLHGLLRLAIASIVLFVAGASVAQAAITCPSAVSPPPLGGVRATVAGAASIAPLDVGSEGPEVSCVNQPSDPPITRMQVCAIYTGLNATSAFPFTLVRSDGRIQNESMTNRLILVPLDAQGNDVDSPAKWNSMLSGRMSAIGRTGVAQFPIRFRVLGQSGSVIEAGEYAGGVMLSLSLVEYDGPPAGSGCVDTTYPPRTLTIASTVTVTLGVTVPSQCTMTQPGALDFGQHVSIAGGALQATSQFSVACNSDSAMFHVYIDEGEHAVAGQRRMQRTGSDDFIAYNLLDRSNRPFPTTSIADASTQGEYTQTTRAAGNSIRIVGQVLPQSRDPRVGRYTDRVTVHVQY